MKTKIDNFCQMTKQKIINTAYCWFTPRKIFIEDKRKYKWIIPIKVNFIDNCEIQTTNLVDISDIHNPKILNYNDNVQTPTWKDEKLFNLFQLKFLALVIPKTCKTIIEIKHYWPLVSYRQARYIRQLRQPDKKLEICDFMIEIYKTVNWN